MNRQDAWEKAVDFHGHKCPGLAIGVMACIAAREKAGIGVADDEEIVCVTENDACGTDAIQALFGCTLGKGNLIYRKTGKQAFSFFDRRSGRKLRLYRKPQTQEMRREEKIRWMLAADVDVLFVFSEPAFALPEPARLFSTVTCRICGEGAPEHLMRLQGGRQVCLDCFRPYDRGW